MFDSVLIFYIIWWFFYFFSKTDFPISIRILARIANGQSVIIKRMLYFNRKERIAVRVDNGK